MKISQDCKIYITEVESNVIEKHIRTQCATIQILGSENCGWRS